MTEYYCKKCKDFFSDENLPNINKVHGKCGELAKIVSYNGKKEDIESDI